LSTSQNPFEVPPALEAGPQAAPPPAEENVAVENPPWSGWGALLIVLLTVVAVIILPSLVVPLAHLTVFKQSSLQQIVRIPEVLLFNELLIYVVVFVVMYEAINTRTGSFWASLSWNWPSFSWARYVGVGVVMCFVLSWVGALLPVPRHLPIERFFETARQATITSIFAVTLAPLMEELFFRGLLYPTLTRWLGQVSSVFTRPAVARQFGVGASILMTAAGFGLLHGAQLGYSWAVLIIFLVGLVLTLVRAITRSVAASFLVHVGYNTTVTIIALIATGGFRHMEKMNQ